MRNIVIIILVIFSNAIFSQNIPMQNGTFTQCTGTFTDSGGAAGNYGLNENFTLTICPDTPGEKVMLEFTAFDTRNLLDFMQIFNGPDVTAPAFGVFTGNTTAIPGLVSATNANASGCLTFTFISGATLTSPGWEATISCGIPCQIITSQLDSATPAPNANGYIRVCPNEEITLEGSGVFSDDGTGATYEWDLGDGNTLPGQTATFSYPNPGVYVVNLNIRDTNTTVNPLGCRNNDFIGQIIQVGTAPDFTGTSAVDSSICLGDDVVINGVVNSVEFNADCTPPVGDLTPLPDGIGISYETSIAVDCYDDGLTLTNVNQIVEICVNIEHSYSGDLDIFIISPNGQIAELLATNPADETYLGGADNNDDGIPGDGVDYCFAMNAGTRLREAATIIAGINPPNNSYMPGTYLPSGNFSSLLGSPLNGNWTIRITDNLQVDDGTIFAWSMEFDSSLLPAELSFEPVITSEAWDADPTITNTVGNSITVEPSLPGNYCYTYRVMDDFGCEYTEQVCIDVLPEIIIDNPSDLFLCDSGAAPYIFDLTQNTSIVTASAPNTADLNVSYYESLANAEAETAPIANPNNYSGTNGQTIFVRIEYLVSDCFKTAAFTLNLTAAPIINTIPNLEFCDDASNDGIGESFDLNAVIPDILGTQPVADYNVTFYLSVADANNKANALISPYINTVNNEPIFVRVELNSNSACFRVSPTALFNLVVNPLDDSSFVTTSDCDGGTVTITGALGGTFSFNPLPTDGAIINPITGTVSNGTLGETYLIEYATNGICPTTTNLPLTAASPFDPSFTVQATCDGGVATITGDGGGVFSFNPIPTDGAVLNTMTGEVTNGTLGTTYTIQYEIALPCLATETQEFTVIQPPEVILTTPLVACDEDTPGDFAFFDLELKNEEVSGGNTSYIISYYNTLAEATNAINPLVSPYLSDSRTVFVRVQDLGEICFAITILDLIVEPLPTVTTVPFLLCDDNMELDGDTTNDSVAFDLESQNGTVLNGQDPINYTVSYYLNQSDANLEINALTSPYENIINPQTIIVRVDNDTMVDDGTGTMVDSSACFQTEEMLLQVNPMPSFDLLDNYTLCVNTDGTEIIAPPIINTGLNTANYTFEWYLNDVILVGEVNSSYSPIQGGIYSVLVTDNTTGCSTVLGDPNAITEVNESTRPDLTANQVTLAFVERNIIFATATASAGTLINGNAAYEFSLDGGSWVNNTPNDGTYTFENVGAGAHTVEARDINGCGITSVIVNVLDYPLYFTPNGDGIHDTWNIVNIASQPDAKIFIFDRFGKLIKQISPTGIGWDGTYNGALMPSDDYWFRLEYTEPTTNQKEEFKAHFTLKR